MRPQRPQRPHTASEWAHRTPLSVAASTQHWGYLYAITSKYLLACSPSPPPPTPTRRWRPEPPEVGERRLVLASYYGPYPAQKYSSAFIGPTSNTPLLSCKITAPWLVIAAPERKQNRTVTNCQWIGGRKGRREGSGGWREGVRAYC